RFAPREAARLALEPGRSAWVQVARGDIAVGGETLSDGDGLAVSGIGELTFDAVTPSEILVFDLA
ncbi:MAG: pirin family protein, partial [Alphaproteobacteria bacterium]